MNMATTPRISVIIPAYNVARHIGETIESVLHQTLADFELIVVNDGSTDATRAAVEKFSDSRLRLIDKPNEGVSIARNTGLAACTAPLVLFLDGDDLLTPDALAAMCRTMAEAPKAVACCGLHEKITEDGAPIADDAKSRAHVRAGSDTLSQLIQGNFIVNGGTLCIRTAAAREVGGFDPALKLGEDWEFWCRLAVLGDFVAMPGFTAMKYRQRISGANVRLTGSGIRPNFEAVDRIFQNAAITGRYPAPAIAAARYNACRMVFWTAARNKLMAGDWFSFLQYAAVGAFRYPPSASQFRAVRRYAASLLAILRLGGGARSNG